MSSSIGDARLRLAYLNQFRELFLGGLLALGLAARDISLPVPTPLLVLLAVWFVAACALVRVVGQAAGPDQLRHIEFAYFLIELLLITLLARFAGAAGWLVLLLYVVSILFAGMVLPRRLALWVAALAGLCFAALLGFERANLTGSTVLHAPAASAWLSGLLILGALLGFALIGLLLSQYSLMLDGQATALRHANRELSRHRDHLEELVAERTLKLERAGEELRRANLDLRRLNDLKSSFLANVSHELRTPLTSIRSFSEILLQYPDEDVLTRQEFLAIVVSESDRLTRLIDQVLDLARIEAGRLELHPARLELGEIVDQSVEMMRVSAARKGLRLVNETPAAAFRVEADADRLRQVFTNLIGNAVKFTADGSVRVGAAMRGPELVAWVADTGCGIPDSEHTRIFDKFHQRGNALVDKPSGAGLGLPISREILQRHGCRIWVESAPGQGSTFFFTLPLAAAAAV